MSDYREQVIRQLRKKFSTKRRDTASFRIDPGIKEAFKKSISKDEQIGVILEDLMLEWIGKRLERLK